LEIRQFNSNIVEKTREVIESGRKTQTAKKMLETSYSPNE